MKKIQQRADVKVTVERVSEQRLASACLCCLSFLLLLRTVFTQPLHHHCVCTIRDSQSTLANDSLYQHEL